MVTTSIIQLPLSDPRWAAFLDSSPRAGIFHHPAWSQLLAECYGYRPFIAALPTADGTLAAATPLMEINSPITGRRWVSLPFSDYCWPLHTGESVPRELAEGMLTLATNNKISSLELRGVYPTLPTLNTSSRYVIHEIDLTPGEQWVWKRTHEMHRRNIKIAQENDVKIALGETTEHLADFYHLHLLTRHRQGVPIQPWKFFKDLKRLLLDQEHGFLLLAYRNGQCLAGAVFLYWKEILTYKYGASRDDSLKYRPNNLVMWTAIQKGCEGGFARFDMGRTDLENTGLRTFKSRWGARETPLVYTHLIDRANHAEEGRLMSYMHTVLQKSPTWFCQLTGELLYKHFG
jgi:CelD/BcsL family acetyltransferase involved in cellulose biosynthesis